MYIKHSLWPCSSLSDHSAGILDALTSTSKRLGQEAVSAEAGELQGTAVIGCKPSFDWCLSATGWVSLGGGGGAGGLSCVIRALGGV